MQSQVAHSAIVYTLTVVKATEFCLSYSCNDAMAWQALWRSSTSVSPTFFFSRASGLVARGLTHFYASLARHGTTT